MHPIARILNSAKKLLLATTGIAAVVIAVTIPVAIAIPTAPRSLAQSPATPPAFV
jgi:hypothetical protein